MKKKLSKTAWAALDEALQALYKKAEGSDNYILDLEDDDDGDTTELKNAKDREKKRAEKAEKELARIQKERDDLEKEKEERETAGALDAEGVKKLKDKHATELQKIKDDASKEKKMLEDFVLDETAGAIAEKISTAPSLLRPKIRESLTLEVVDGIVHKRVLKDGAVSDSKLEDLEKDFIANEEYASIIAGSRGSGGGAAGARKGGGASKKALKDMTATEESQFANDNPAEYDRMLAEQDGSAAA